jgi:hypothetical protein
MLAVGYLNGKNMDIFKYGQDISGLRFHSKTITYIKRRLEYSSTLENERKGYCSSKITVGALV